METIRITGDDLTLQDLVQVARRGVRVALADEAIQRITVSRNYVDEIVRQNRPVYGVTTGFGKFSDVAISSEQTKELQRNLIMSHACGTGAYFPEEVVRAMMLLRANALAKGSSGIRLETVETLLAMLNKGVCPAVPEKGSLGASGDLAPLAHMVLPLLGLGQAYYKGKLVPGAQAMKAAGVAPLELVAKEGLALINGTQAMTAVGALATWDALQLAKTADIAAALTGEALNCVIDAYLPEMHSVRPHPCQMSTARNLRNLLTDSARTTHQGELRIQDAYSIRCVPQIHGASRDAIGYVEAKLKIEFNSVTDNPVILPQLDLALSGGNFHGQPMALAFDFLGIALAEFASVSERRIERLVNPQLSGLPAFLVNNGGLSSGFMIVQYVAAALVSENKVLAHPASVDSIPSSANQEDHVSMGTIAARKARDIGENAARVVAIELMTAAQGVDLNEASAGKRLGRGTQPAYDLIRSVVPVLEHDRILYEDIEKVVGLVQSGRVVDAVEKAVGPLA